MVNHPNNDAKKIMVNQSVNTQWHQHSTIK